MFPMSIFVRLYPRDAMLARSYRPVSVCLCRSVTSRCSIERNEWISLICGMDAFFDQSYTVF